MKKNNLIGLLLVASLFLASSASAEVVILKSGERVEGKIIEETDEYLMVDVYGVPIACFHADIAGVQKKTRKHLADNPLGQYFAKGLSYAINGEFIDAKKEFMNARGESNSKMPAQSALDIIADVFNQRVRKNTAIYMFKAVDYRCRGMQNQAIGEFSNAIANNKSYDKAYFNRGVIYGLKGQHEQAVLDYNKAIELNPDYVVAYFNRGVIYGRKGQFDKAIFDYTQTIKIDPKHYLAYFNRGLNYDIKDDYEQAVSDYTKAIQINPQFAKAYSNRGLAFASQGLYDQAIADCDAAIKADPESVGMYFNKALVCEEANRVGEAIEAYEKFIDCAPGDATYYIDLARENINRLKEYYREFREQSSEID